MSTAESSPVAILDLNVYRGDNFNHQITWQDSTGDPIDLTGYQAKMQVRKTVGSTVLMEATDGNGLALGGVKGTIDIQLSPIQTTINTKDNIYDLRVTSLAGFVTTVIKGIFVVSQDVTR